VEDGFALSRPGVPLRLAPSLLVLFEYGRDSTVPEPVPDDRDKLQGDLAQRVSGQAVASFAFAPWLLYAGMPFNLASSLHQPLGTALGALGREESPVDYFWFGARRTLVDLRRWPLHLGAQATLALPVPGGGGYMLSYAKGGNLHPELLAELGRGRLRASGNLGLHLHNVLGNHPVPLGHELTFALGATARLGRGEGSRVDLHAELFGATSLAAFGAPELSPLASLLGLKFFTAGGLAAGLAVGPGLAPGYGVPELRVLLSVGVGPSPVRRPARLPAHDELATGRAVRPVAAARRRAAVRRATADRDRPDREDHDREQPDEPRSPGRVQASLMRLRDREAPASELSDATELQLEDGQLVLSGTIEFDAGGTRLAPSSTPVLRELLALLREHREILLLRVIGHTDNRGPDRRNLLISAQRARAVVSWLLARGIARSRLEGWGCGERLPVADNQQRHGRRRNRRVELHVLRPRPGAAALPVEDLCQRSAVR
jgi:outer membrane protein OmpA-like peptidoglycan-associated protein